jgi:signal transduction histidine kinase
MPHMTTLIALPGWVLGPAYLASYVLLDFVSFIFPLSPVGITPWNPQTGLSFALILIWGRAYLPLLFIAPVLTEFLVHRMPVSVWYEAGAVMVIGFGYAAATMVLLHPRLRLDPTLSALRDLALLTMVAATASAIVALAYTLIFALSGLLVWEQYLGAALHHWVGDAIGILVVTPFLLSLATAVRFPRPTLEMVAQMAALAATVWVIFGFGRAAEFQFFYLLFLPIIWIAVRFGLEGTSAGLFGTQAALVLALEWTDQPAADATKFQLLMLVLTLTGLVLGVAVSGERRSQTRLRLHQEALARASRLTSLSTLATVIAHEINQPLTAIGNYVRLVRDMIGSGEGHTPAARQASEKAIVQIDHAARLIRHFRQLVRERRSELVPTPPSHIVAETLQLAEPLLESAGVHVQTRIAERMSPVLVDRLQFQQVLLNIIANSVEALKTSGRLAGRIVIEVGPSKDGHVEFRLRDDGPGFPPEASVGTNSFVSTKFEGTGLGLTLSRAIVQRHSGRLTTGNHAGGAVVVVSLPPAEETQGRV